MGLTLTIKKNNEPYEIERYTNNVIYIICDK